MKDLTTESTTLSPLEAGNVKVVPAIQGSAVLYGVFVEAVDGDLNKYGPLNKDGQGKVEIPNDATARRKFLTKWSEDNKARALKGLGISVLLLPLAACGGGGTVETINTDPPTVARLIDGYITNGFVFRDENGDGIFQASNEASAYSGSDGFVTIGGTSSKPIILDQSQDPEGRTAVDLDKPNEAFTSVLATTGGSSVVTPLTTMVKQLVDSGESEAAAQTAVKSALGISSAVDLTTVDPIASDNVEVYKAGVQVAGLMEAAGGGAAGLEVTKALSSAAKTAAASSGTVDLTSADAVRSIVAAAKTANPSALSTVDVDEVSVSSSSQATAVASATSTDAIAAVQAATFIVSESSGEVSFGGTATGAVIMTMNASGGATFSRGGVDGKASSASDAQVVTVSSIATKEIAGSVDLTVVLTGAGTAGDDKIVVNAPNANSIELRGSMGDGNNSAVIKVEDVVSGSADVRNLTIDTSSMVVSSLDSIVFDFDGAEDIVILSSTSDIAQFSTIEISKGTADLRSVTVKDGVDLIVNSGVILSQAQFGALDSLVSASGKGEVTIGLGSGETLTTLNALFATGANDDFIMIGTDITVTDASSAIILKTVDGSVTVGSMPSNLASMTFPGIPALSASLTTLNTQVSAFVSGSSEISSVATLDSLSEISTAVGAINLYLTTGTPSTLVPATQLEADLASLQTQITDIRSALSSPLTVSLSSDTGTIGDGLTSVNTVKVHGLDASRDWAYSINGGSSWTDVTSTSSSPVTTFVFSGTLATGSVLAKQLEAASTTVTIYSDSNKIPYTLDAAVPTVLNVTSTAADDFYNVGDVIDIVVTFSEDVFVTGTPQLTLETGGVDRAVNYSSGTGTTALTFQYTVQEGDTAADLDYKAIDSLALNGGTINDASGNAATLTLASPNAANSISDNQAIVVDTIAPSFSSSGSASAIVENSSSSAIYDANASDGNTLVYSLKTSGDHASFQIDSASGVVTLKDSVNPNFEIKDVYNFTVVATDPAGNATEQNVTLPIKNVDESSPVFVSGATGSTVAENSTGTVVYDADVTDGADVSAGITYSLKNNVGDEAKFGIDATTGKVTQTGSFNYDTTPADTSYTFTVIASDGVTTPTEIVVTGTITDVDEVRPTVSNVTSTASNDHYKVGDVIDIVVTFDEAVFVTGTPQLTLGTGGSGRAVNYSSGSGTTALTFQYTVQEGDTAADLDYATTGSLSEGNGTIKDGAGNSAVLTLASPGATNSISDNQAIVVDTTVPTISIASTLEGDNIVNAVEDASVEISGTTSGIAEGGVVTVTFTDGTTTITKTDAVAANGTFALAGDQIADISSLKDGPITVTASVSDAAGNAAVAASRTLTLDKVDPQVSIDTTLEVDNIINNAEKGTVVVTGTSAGAVGRTVTITAADSGTGSVNNTGIIQTDGTYSVTLPSMATGFADGNITITASVSDAAGNNATQASKTITLDDTSATVTGVSAPDIADGSYNAGTIIPIEVTFSEVVNVTGTPQLKLETGGTDRLVNYKSGSGTDVLVFEYTVQDGDTSGDLNYHASGPLTLNGGTINDVSGNTATLALANSGASGALDNAKALVIDTTVPTISIASTLEGDNIVNAVEDASVEISGTTSGIAEGGVVTVTFTDGTTTITKTDAVAANGTFALAGDQIADISSLKDGPITVTASVSDAAGNAAVAASRTLTLDKVDPQVSIDTTLEVDNIINNAEKGTVVVTGTSAGAVGRTVTITAADSGTGSVNNTGIIQTDGTYSVTLPSMATGFADGNITITASVSDAAGNNATQASKTITLDDTSATVTGVSAPDIADGSYNAGTIIPIEVTFSEVVNVTGTPQLKLETGGTDRLVNYKSGSGTDVLVFEYTVQDGDTSGDLNYHASGPLTLNGGTINDVSGNTATLALANSGASGALDNAKALVIDTTVPTISIASTLEGDNIVNAVEDASVEISGTTSGIAEGGVVTVTFTDGTTTITKTDAVAANGTFALAGDQIADISSLKDGPITVTASVSDAAGNAAVAASRTLTLDKVDPQVSIDTTLEVDNIINNAEKGTVVVTGTSAGAVGRTVTITAADSGTGSVNNTGIIQTDGTYSVTLPSMATGFADGNITITASVSDAAGNNATQASKTITLDDTSATVTGVSAPDIADGSYNAGTIIPIEVTFSEVVNVTGTPQLKLETGGTDRLVNYKSGSGTDVLVFEYTVQDGDTSGDLNYHASGPLTLNGGTINDVSGNTATLALANSGASGALDNAKALVIDTTVPTISIASTLEGDNIVNAVEDASVEISGTTSGIAEGGVVTVTFTDGTTTITKTDAVAANGTFALAGDQIADISSLKDGPITVTASVSDAAGNAAVAASRTLTLDKVDPQVSIDTTLEVDNIINNAEKGTVVVTGTSAGAVGRTVTITAADSGTGSVNNTGIIQTDGTYSVTLPSMATGFADGNITITASVSDAAGNNATQASKTITLDDTDPTITSVSADWGDSLVTAEDDQAMAVTVVTSGVDNGKLARVTLNSTTYVGTVYSNTAVIVIPALALQALTDTVSYTLFTDVDDLAGNSATQNTGSTFVVQRGAPVVEWGSTTNTTFKFTATDPNSDAMTLDSDTSDTSSSFTEDVGGNPTNQVAAGTVSTFTVAENSANTGQLLYVTDETYNVQITSIVGGVAKGVKVYTGATGADDTIVVSNGNAGLVYAFGGDDVVTGSSGQDTIYGGAGADVMTGGGAADYLYGEAGNDTFKFASGAELNFDATIDGGADTDTIQITAAATDITDDDFTRIVNVEKLTLANGTNTVVLGTAAKASFAALTLTGGTGADSITLTTYNEDATIIGGGGADSILGSAQADTFQLESSAQAAAVTTISGAAGTDILHFTAADADIRDAELAKVRTIETLQLTGASSATLGTEASNAGLALTSGTIRIGNDHTTINADNSIHFAIDAQDLADDKILTLTDVATSNFEVTGLQGSLTATDLLGTLTVTTAAATDNAIEQIQTSAAATFVTTTASAASSDAVTIDAENLADDITLTLNNGGGAAGTVSITNLIGNLTTTNVTSGAIAITVDDDATTEIAVSGNVNAGVDYTVTGGDGGGTVTFAATAGDIIGDGSLGDKLVVIGTSADQAITGGTLADTITGAGGADTLKGGDGNDVFKFHDTTHLLEATGSVKGEGGTDVVYLTNVDTGVADADFAKVRTIETLQLTGASSATLGTEASNAGLATGNSGTIRIGNDHTTINADNSIHFTIDAQDLADDKILTLTDVATSNFVVTGLQGNLTATSLLGTLTVTTAAAAVDNAIEKIETSAAATFVTTTASAASSDAVTIDAENLADDITLTLNNAGGAAGTVSITNLIGDLDVNATSGAIAITVDDEAGSTIAVAGNTNAGVDYTITGGDGGSTVTFAATAGDIIGDGSLADKLVVTGTSAAQAITGGTLADTITGAGGADTLKGGLGDDIFKFHDTDHLLAATGSVKGEGGTDVVHLTTADTGVADADFAKVRTIETLQLTGASSATLGTEASNAGLALTSGTIRIGNDHTTINADNSIHFAIDAQDLADDKILTLTDVATSNFEVTGLQGSLTATDLLGTLTVTTAAATDNAIEQIQTSAAATFVTTTASAASSDAVTIDAENLADDITLTLNNGGGAAGTVSITNLIGNLTTTNVTSGAIAITVDDDATTEIAVSGNVNAGVDYTVTGGDGGGTVTFAATAGDIIGDGSLGDKLVVTGTSADQAITGGTLADTITGAGGADTLKGGDGNDVFKFHDTTHLLEATGSVKGEGGTDVVYLTNVDTGVADADFAKVRTIETLQLTGASSATLGTEASNAGLATGNSGTIRIGNDHTTINADNSIHFTIDAQDLADDKILTLTDVATSNFVVTGLQGNLTATSLLGTLTVTTAAAAVDNAIEKIETSAAATFVTTTASAASSDAVTIDAENLADDITLTLNNAGGAAGTVSITNLIGDLDVNATSGAIAITVDDEAGSTIAVAGNTNAGVDYTITGGDGGSTVTFAATAGDIIGDGSLADKLVVTGTSAAQAITGGTLADTITGAGGADTLKGGLGDDIFKFHDTDHLLAATGSVKGEGGTDVVHLTTADTGVADADFAKVRTIETLQLTGASSATLGTEASNAGLALTSGTIRIGNDHTTINADNSIHFAIDAQDLADDKILTLTDVATSNFEVTGLQGSLTATDLLGTLTVTTAAATDNAIEQIQTSAAATFVTTTASAASSDAVTIDAENLADDITLTLNNGGGAAGTVSITNLIGNLTTTNVTSGAIAITVDDDATTEIAVSGNVNAGVDYTVTGGDGGGTVTFAATAGDIIGDGSLGDKLVVTGTSADQAITGGTLADTITGAGGADTLKGGDGNDVFKFHDTTHLLEATGSVKGEGGTDVVYLTNVDTGVADADFAKVRTIETLQLTGASSATLGTEASNAGLATGNSGTIRIGNDHTTINADNSIHFTIDAQDLADDKILTLTDVATSNFVVTGLQGNLTATSLLGTLTVTTAAAAVDNAIEKIETSAAATFVTTTASAASSDAVTIDAENLADDITLTLNNAGGAAGTVSITNLIGDLDVNATSGAIAITVDDEAGSTIAVAGNANAGVDYTITGGDGGSTVTFAATAGDIIGDGSLADKLVVTGTSAAQTITGGTLADTITGAGGNDKLQGGDGNDVFLIAAAADHTSAATITGGNNTDVVRFTSTASGTLTVSSAVNVETVMISAADGTTTGTTGENIDASNNTNALALTGNDGANAITGTSAANVIVGNAGNDTIKSGAGADNITAGAGDDVLVVSSATADDETGASATYDGEGNTDTLIVTGGTNAVNFSNDTVQNVETLELTKQEDNTSADTNAQSLTMTDSQVDAISTINSADGDKVTLNDVMTADMLNNTHINGIFELVLGDFTNSLTLADDARMDADSDRLEVDGSNSASKLTFDGSNETAAEVSITGGSAGDAITAGGGADTIMGGAGVDTLVGGSGNDKFVYNSAVADQTGTSEQITGGADTDTIVVSGGTTDVDFSNDTLATIEILELTKDKDNNTDNNDQTIKLLDTQFGMLSGINANTGSGGASDKIILADVATSDMLTNGTNTVIDGTLTLQLKNEASNALTLADANMVSTNDLLIIDGSLLTGTNALTFDGSLEASAEMSITGGAAGDTIKAGGGNDTIDAGAGTDSIDAGAGNDIVLFDANAELAGDLTVVGGAGTDTIKLETGTANLTIDESSFGDVDGFEVLAFNGTGIHTVDFGSDIGGAFANGITITINSSATSLNVSKYNGNVTMNATGTDNNDTLLGGTVNDVLSGGSGHDSIDGSSGNDTIGGGAGNDTIIGGAGADNITLGDGSNVLIFNSTTGSDTIVDYEVGDSIQLDNSKLLGASSNFSDGALDASAFQNANADTASTADVRIIYNKDNNKLFFDADGSGGSNAIELATFSSNVDDILSVGEFTII